MKMRKLLIGAAIISSIGIGAARLIVAAQPEKAQDDAVLGTHKGGTDLSGPYDVVPNWPETQRFEGNLVWNRTSSVFAETPDRIYVLQSGVVPPSYRMLHGDQLLGAQLATFNLGKPMIRPAYAGIHCGTNYHLGNDKSKWLCTIAPDGKMIDSIIDQTTEAKIEGAKWDYTLVVLNRNGRVIENWSQWNSLLGHPHHVMINPYDPEKHVWVVDAGTQQVFKFSHDGKKLVMALGKHREQSKERTGDKELFGNPTSIAFAPNGEFFVGDGYRNARVIKFSKDGKYLREFGKFGKAPGELDTVHSIAVAKGRVYVADRGNSRISVFDLDGKFIEIWPNVPFPLFLAASKDGYIWVADGKANKMLKFTLDGHLVDAWGTFGNEPGQMWGEHYFNTDSEGNFYTSSVFGGRIQKFTPRQDVDKKRLIGPLASPGFVE